MTKFPKFQRNGTNWWRFQIFKMLGYAAYLTRTPHSNNFIWQAYISYGQGNKLWRIWR